MDQNHPIPQQISSYQFRLVGDMTLKQFFQIAGGAIVGIILYASPLHPIIKWPLIIFSGLVGVALAFLPFEERPLERWIFAFFKSVYSPTVFNWQKTIKPPVFFQEEAPLPAEKIIAPQGEAALRAYLATTPEEKNPTFQRLEGAEKDFLSKISQILVLNEKGGYSVQTQVYTPTQPAPAKEKQPLIVPESQPVSFVPSKPKVVVEEKIQPQEAKLTSVTPVVGSQAPSGAGRAQFVLEAAPPNPPTTPNTIVGQIVDVNGKIIEGAIMEIRDIAGRPVRALRSNKVGHFIIVTPLTNGKYEIISEKEGYSFTPVSFEAVGEIIPPIQITGKPLAKVVELEQTAIGSQPVQSIN